MTIEQFYAFLDKHVIPLNIVRSANCKKPFFACLTSVDLKDDDRALISGHGLTPDEAVHDLIATVAGKTIITKTNRTTTVINEITVETVDVV